MFIRRLYIALSLVASSFVAAAPAASPTVPTPSRPFTVRSYQSPYPVGAGVTGYYLTAYDGKFLLTKTAPKDGEIKLNVDQNGNAFIVSGSNAGAPLYLETVDGMLSYYLKGVGQPPIGPVVTNFLHLGSGTNVSSPDPDNPGYNGPFAIFQWVGSLNDYWFACEWSKAPPGQAYRIFKEMRPDGTDVSGPNCNGVLLAAINA